MRVNFEIRHCRKGKCVESGPLRCDCTCDDCLGSAILEAGHPEEELPQRIAEARQAMLRGPKNKSTSP